MHGVMHCSCVIIATFPMENNLIYYNFRKESIRQNGNFVVLWRSLREKEVISKEFSMEIIIRPASLQDAAKILNIYKYYITDTGLRNTLLGYRNIDSGHILETLVFLELKRRKEQE